MKNSKTQLYRILTILFFFSLFINICFADFQVENVAHFGGWPKAMAVKGNHAFLVQGIILTVFDVSGGDFQRVSYLELAEEPDQIKINGNYAFTFSTWSDSALQIIDISDPLKPIFVTSFALKSSRTANGFVTDKHIYIATKDSLKIVDITNPNNPAIVKLMEVAVENVFISGQYAYFDTDNGMGIYNVTDPANPLLENTYGNFEVDGLFVSGNYAYVGQQDAVAHGMHVVNISNPLAPKQEGFVDTKIVEGNSTYFKNPSVIDVENNTAYIGCENGWLFTADVKDPAKPTILGSLEFLPDSWPDFTSFQSLSPNLYFTTKNYGPEGPGVYIIDIQDPAYPHIQAILQEPTELRHLATSNDTLYLSSVEGLWVYKVTNPEDPVFTLLGLESSFREMMRIFYSDRMIYGIKSDTLFLIDVADPGNIFEVGRYVSSDFIRDLYVLNNYVYLINGFSNSFLEIIDITDPNKPVKTKDLDLQAEARDIVVTEGSVTAYVAYYKDENDKGFKVIDITDPTDPKVIASGPTDGKPDCIAIRQNLLIIGSNSSSLGKNIPDESNQTNIGSTVWKVAAYNIGNKFSPSLLHSQTGIGRIVAISLEHDEIAASINDNCIWFFEDIFMNDDYLDFNEFMFKLKKVCPSPASTFIDVLWFVGSMHYLWVSLDGYCCADMLEAYASWGCFFQWLVKTAANVEEYKMDTKPDKFYLSQNYPNPFNPQTTIEFQIKEVCRVTIKVYNIRGEEVMTLLDKNLVPGKYQKVMNSRDLAAGAYFYEIQAGNFNSRHKMILIK
jgi:hypothetical protein